jgi:hypothetical protein
MKNINTAELHLHCSILLNPGTTTLSLLIEMQADHLLRYLTSCYGKHLHNRKHFASEAVYNTLEWYHDHPRLYNPQHGGLRKFLELRARKQLQEIFNREGYTLHIFSTDHLLACHLDNQHDVEIAKLLLKGEKELMRYIHYVDTSNIRFKQIKSEIERNKHRIQQVLDELFVQKREKILAPVVYMDQTDLHVWELRRTGL